MPNVNIRVPPAVSKRRGRPIRIRVPSTELNVVEWVIPVPVAVRPEQPPASSPLDWEWNVPSLQNEQDFYTNVMGWTIPSDAKNFTDPGTGGYTWINPNNYSFGNIHNNMEGDNLWTWTQQYNRWGAGTQVGQGYTLTDWRDVMTTYFKNNLLSTLDSTDNGGNAGFGYDHMWGQGLALRYYESGDASILTVLDGLRSRIEGISEYQTLASGGTLTIGTWEARAPARWTIVATHAAEATNDPNWITVRDNMARAFETSPDWEEGGVIKNGGGLFFASRAAASFIGESGGTAAYDAGRRFHSSFQVGLMAEAMWRCYVQTGSSILKDRLIKMARYVQYYGHDPTWVGPGVGSRFGHEGDGTRWHSDTTPDSGDITVHPNDCSYDMSLVNCLVIGYKFTGDATLLERAKAHFSRGNRWNPGDGTAKWTSSLNEIDKFVDTKMAPSSTSGEFQFNKGILQYASQIFENGGSPNKVTSDPSWYNNMTEDEAHLFTNSDWRSNLGNYPGTSGAENGTTGLYSYSGGILNTKGLYEYNSSTYQEGKFFCMFGGGHNAYNGNEIAAFGPLDSDSPSWFWAAPAVPTNTNQNIGSFGQPNSQHTYAMLDYIETKNWLFDAFVNNRYSDSGAGVDCSAFDFGVANPQTNYSTAWISNLDDISSVTTQYGGSFGAYDRYQDKYWLLCGRGQTVLWEYDVQNDQWTRYPSSGAYATLSYSDEQRCAIDPVTQVMMITTDDSGGANDHSLRCIDLRNPSAGIYKPGGSNHPINNHGLLFDPVNRRWVSYGGGSTMWVCPVPSNPYSGGDNFNFSSVTLTGDVPDLPSVISPTPSSVWGRFKWCPQPQGYVYSASYFSDMAFIKV